jgi:hypothetical protein
MRPGETFTGTERARRSRLRTARCPRSRIRSRRRCERGAADHSARPRTAERRHRASERSAEDTYELVGLLVVAFSSTKTPRRQFPSVITFGVSAIAATLSPPTSVPSTSPSRMSKERHRAKVVSGAVIHGHVARAHELVGAGFYAAPFHVPGRADLRVTQAGSSRLVQVNCKSEQRSGAGVEPTQRGAATPHRF